MWKSLILPLLAAVLPSAAPETADEVNVSKGGTLAGPGLAAHGFDPVAYFTDGKAEVGSDIYAVAHAGGTYRFTSKAHLDQFRRQALSQPERRHPGGMVEGHPRQHRQSRQELGSHPRNAGT